MADDHDDAPPSNPLLGTITSQHIENARKSSQRRSSQRVCYDGLLRNCGPSSVINPRKSVISGHRDCYEKLLRHLPKGVSRRGRNFYYRHMVPVDAQRLLNRLEIWRSLRTDSLAVALRRLPSVIACIEMDIEQARSNAGLPVDATLIRPSLDEPAERALPIMPLIARPDNPLTLAEAYRNYIDDPTRAWTANTREAYETSRKLAVAVIGETVPITSISRAQCREMLDVLRFLPANAAKVFPRLSPREAAERARMRGDINRFSQRKLIRHAIS